MSKKKGTADRGRRTAGKAPQKASDVRLAEHPRARRSIGLAKSYAGLGAFLLAGYISWKAGLEFVDVAVRALLWGIAAYLLVWTLAVHLWRHIAVAEVRAVERRWEERKAAEAEQVQKLTAVLEENGMPTTGTGAPPV